MKAHPGPLCRERLGVRLSSYSVSLSRSYPVDETSDENAVIRTNGGIAAFLPGLNRCQVLRHEADDGPFYRWPLTTRIHERMETWRTTIVELGYNGAPPRCAEAFADGLRSFVVQPVWLHALDETARIEGGGPSPVRRQRQFSSIRETTSPFEGPIRQKSINPPSPFPLHLLCIPYPHI